MSIAVAVYSAGWVSGACSYSLARQRHPLCAHLDLWNPTPTSKTADETESNLETAFRDAPGVDSLLEGAVKVRAQDLHATILSEPSYAKAFGMRVTLRPSCVLT